MAFSFRMRSWISGLNPASLKSLIHRSGAINGKSDPNSILRFSCVFAYWTNWGGKYLGDQPDRSMYTLTLCRHTDNASSCHGHDGWAMMIFMSGKSAATSSTCIGLEYLRRRPPPPGMPVPIPECPL